MAQYTALETPVEEREEAGDTIHINIAPVPTAVVPVHDEKWIESTILPQFTYQDAQAMEWDYANVTKQNLRHSLLSRVGSKASRLSYRSSEFGDPDREIKEDLGVLLDPFYDVTTGRLRRMFKHFSPQGKEEVTYDEFQNGLLALGISVPSSMSFRDFVRKVDTNGDGVISLDEFVKVVQMIKLAHLFRPEHDQVDKHILRVVDYSPTNMHAVAPVTKLQSFMFSTKPTWAKVRWVHLAGFHKLDDLNMRRLAIKYQLHPLAVEDCLNQNDKIRCKYEHYEDHAFLVVPVLRALSLEKRGHIEDCIAAYRQDVFNKRQALMKDGITDHPIVETKESLAAKLNELKVITQVPEQLCVFVNLTTNNVLSVQADVDNDTSAFMLWDALFDHNMEKSYSKVRCHDAPFLVVSLLNAVVDEILPLVEVFEAKFELQGQLLRLEGIKFDTMRFALAKKQLRALEKIVRPLLDLVQDHLFDQDEFNRGEVKNYLRDVKDHLKQMTADLQSHYQTLAALLEEDKEIRAKSQADALYIMSVVAACLLPGTFMTGVYGMNFDNMPELHAQNGYYVWWAVLCSIITAVVVYIKFYKHWL